MQIVNNNSGNAALEQTSRAAETQATSSSAKGAGAQAPASQADGLQLSKFAGTLSHVLQTDSTSRSQRVAQILRRDALNHCHGT